MSSFLFDVRVAVRRLLARPRWWAVLIGLLIVAALASAAVPVLRALRLSPADVLRQQ